MIITHIFITKLKYYSLVISRVYILYIKPFVGLQFLQHSPAQGEKWLYFSHCYFIKLCLCEALNAFLAQMLCNVSEVKVICGRVSELKNELWWNASRVYELIYENWTQKNLDWHYHRWSLVWSKRYRKNINENNFAKLTHMHM